MSTVGSHRARRQPAPSAAGPEGNERLTAITGAVLLVLFAAEGVTILSLHQLLYWHYFIGFLLIGPVCVKLCSTLYRFTRYYTGEAAYVAKGPPQPLLRFLGPVVVLTSIAVLGTGVLLGVERNSSIVGVPLLFLHKASFVLWAGAMSIHVLAYVWRLPTLIADDMRPRRTLAGRGMRWSLTAVGLGAGAGIAFAAAHLASAWRR